MNTFEAVLKPEEIRIKIRLVKGFCREPVFLISGQPVELIKTVIHAAEFDRQNSLPRLLIPGKDTLTGPFAKRQADLLCTFGLRNRPEIDQALEHLMHRIPRHPLLTLCFSLENIELELLILRIRNIRRAQESAAVLFLAFGKARDDFLSL